MGLGLLVTIPLTYCIIVATFEDIIALNEVDNNAENIMDAGKAEHYRTAVDWLKKARAAYLESGSESDWSNYKESLIQQHARKRKLMGLFKQASMR